MADVNPRPVIQDLQPGDWIDLDQLGDKTLLTYIKYPGIAIDDALWPNWRGCGALGEVEDYANSRVDVTVGGGYTPALGMPVLVPNDRLKSLDQGWAFYSYAVGDPNDPNVIGPESLRVFCYVGKRAEQSVPSPVAQIKESHELALDPNAVGSQGATVGVPPYSAMGVGDRVIFSWQGYFQGIPDPLDYYEEPQLIKAENIGQPLTFNVPQVYVTGIAGEYADINYRIEYAGGAGQPTPSAAQRIRIVKPATALLPPVTIKGYTGGPINPGRYRDGLTLQVKPVYAGIREGDWVLVYWTGSQKAKSVTKALRVDRSTLDSGIIEFLIEPEWLTLNSNSRVSLVYQYAREGGAQSAEALDLEITKPLELPPPEVERATAEALGYGRLAADTDGAHVNVPAAAEIGLGKVEMHWEGHPKGGQHIALAPVSGRRYKIPSTAIAANMSGLVDAYFKVFYRVFPPGSDDYEDSDHFNLRITPLPATQYPLTTSPQIADNKMSVNGVPIGGAELVIANQPFDPWPFMAVGQLLTIEVSGVDQNSQGISIKVRDAIPVTQTEVSYKKVTAKLPKAFLQNLKRNVTFTIKARVSFNGGDTYHDFPNVTPTLVD